MQRCLAVNAPGVVHPSAWLHPMCAALVHTSFIVHVHLCSDCPLRMLCRFLSENLVCTESSSSTFDVSMAVPENFTRNTVVLTS
jgi:hypothetical protein